MKYIYLVMLCAIFSFRLGAQIDLDVDWIDDGWEKAFDLDDSKEFDAYQDLDGDHIINLFEYKLGSDPTDPSSPYTIPYDPSDDLKTVIQSAPKGSVIKVPEGIHSLEWLKFFRDDAQIMIQGGWSSDFSEFDPSTYKTILHGGDFTVFSLGFLKQSDNVFIVEGLTTQNNKDLFAPFDISFADTTNTFFAVHDCYISGMESALKFSHYDEARTQISITKNYLVENEGQGIDVSVSDKTSTRFKIINNTIAANKLNETGFFSGSALEFTTLNEGSGDIDFRNNIIWGNEKGAYELAGFGTSIEFSQYDYNLVMGLQDIKGVVNIPNPCCQKSTDPMFKTNSFELSEESQCIDEGMIVGFDYLGAGQDIGAYEFNAITSSRKLHNLNDGLKVYPNPFRDILNFTLKEEVKGDIHINIYTLEGKIQDQLFYKLNPGLFQIDMTKYPKGTYILEVQNDVLASSAIIQKI